MLIKLEWIGDWSPSFPVSYAKFVLRSHESFKELVELSITSLHCVVCRLRRQLLGELKCNSPLPNHAETIPYWMPSRSIFCSRTLSLRAITTIGYDLDYTLIHYNVKVQTLQPRPREIKALGSCWMQTPKHAYSNDWSHRYVKYHSAICFVDRHGKEGHTSMD